MEFTATFLPNPPQAYAANPVAWQRLVQLNKSRPATQFAIQVHHEYYRLVGETLKGESDKLGRSRVQTCIDQTNNGKVRAARLNVKSRWIKRRIWNHAWGYREDKTFHLWRHEEAAQYPDNSLLGKVFPKQSTRIPPCLLVRNQLIEAARHNEASRPRNQFLVQVIEEIIATENADQSRLRNDPSISMNVFGNDPDLEAKARQTIKDRWIDDQIWSEEWHSEPGLVWPHERVDAESFKDMPKVTVPNQWDTTPFPESYLEPQYSETVSFMRLFNNVLAWQCAIVLEEQYDDAVMSPNGRNVKYYSFDLEKHWDTQYEARMAQESDSVQMDSDSDDSDKIAEGWINVEYHRERE